jgi:FKBP-type peptidyl-prolyl cis-trans isomerase
MADKRDFAVRFGTLFMAMLFLLTAIAFTAVIFWQSRQESKNNDLTSELNQQLEEQTNQETGENMLEGTQLADFAPITGSVTELQKVDLVEGTGEEVKAGATVTAHYTGAYASTGEIFQSSHDSGNPYPFSLDGVIAGWTQGVPGMKVGGKRRLVIPGNLAYGEAPEGYTPGSTERPMGPLVFDIELTAVQNP